MQMPAGFTELLNNMLLKSPSVFKTNYFLTKSIIFGHNIHYLELYQGSLHLYLSHNVNCKINKTNSGYSLLGPAWKSAQRRIYCDPCC